MLTQQVFKTKGYKVELLRVEDNGGVQITNIETGAKQSLRFDNLVILRKVISILADSPFIFSERNNDK